MKENENMKNKFQSTGFFLLFVVISYHFVFISYQFFTMAENNPVRGTYLTYSNEIRRIVVHSTVYNESNSFISIFFKISVELPRCGKSIDSIYFNCYSKR